MVAPPWIHIFLGRTKETKPRDAPKSQKNKQINARLPKTPEKTIETTDTTQARPPGDKKKQLRKQKNQTKPSRRPKNQSSQTAFHHACVVQKPNSDK